MRLSRLFRCSCLAGSLLLATFPTIRGQVALGQEVLPDATVSTQVSEDLGKNQFTVTGGSLQGSNLFHSFLTFSPRDRSVLFDLNGLGNAGLQIERILSRVTGDEPSQINGLIDVLGGNNPDLFLLNPNGIIFGPEARLNLGGSFIGSTANTIQFADGQTFSTTPSADPSLLSISVPIGLQLGQDPGAIEVLGDGHQLIRASRFSPLLPDPATPVQGLQVAPGNTLALIGGEIQFNGGVVNPRHTSGPQGSALPLGGTQIYLAAGAESSVQLQPSSGGWDIDSSGLLSQGDITLSNRAWIDASGLNLSQTEIVGRNIRVEGGSAITMNLLGDSPNGLLSLSASEKISIAGDANSPSDIQTTTLGQGNGGRLNLQAEFLEILDGANVSASSFGPGTAGDVSVEIGQDFRINGWTQAFPDPWSVTLLSTSAFSSGDAGALNVKTRTLTVDNGGLLSSSTLGDGAGGELSIEATERISLRGMNPSSFAPASLSSASFGSGDAGKTVAVKTKHLEVLEGAVLEASAYASGNAGNVLVEASESITVGGADGTLLSPAQIGLPGQIGSNVIDDIPGLDNFILLDTPTGRAGSVTLQTPRLNVRDGGKITVTNRGLGDAGNIEITTQQLHLKNRAEITAETAAGSGGSIDIQAQESLLLRQNSKILASAKGRGNEGKGGNILIQTPRLVAVPSENSDISADAERQSGGSIEITAASILGLSEQSQPTERSAITASSELGTQGKVELSQLDTDVASGIIELPSSFSEQNTVPVANACSSNSTQLARQGRGGLPLGPNNLLHDTLFVEGENDLINQAIALRNQGFYAKALQLLQTEMASLEMEAELERKAIALRQLGITHKLLEQHLESRATLEQSLKISQRLNLPEQTSATLLSLGNLTRAKNKLEEARKYYQQALNEGLDPTLRHQILANQLSLEVALGENQNAVKRLAQTLLDELAGDIRDPRHLETRLNVAATLLNHRRLDLFPNFMTVLQQDLEGAQRTEDPAAIAYALGHLSKAHEQTGNWPKAQQFAQVALNQAQRQQEPFQEYRWAWQLGRVTGLRWEASGDEQWRSQSKIAYKIALNALRQLRGDLATVSPALQFSFRQRVEPVYRQYVNLLLTSNHWQTQPSSDLKQSDLKQALQTIEALRLAELDNFFQDACLETTPQSIENLDANAAVVYPILLDDRIAVIFSYQGQLRHHIIPIPSQRLEATARSFWKKLVTRSRQDYQQPSQQLYNWLIHPMLSELEAAEIETLVFVPDGPLATIPLAALYDGEQFLIEQFNVAIAPSLQLLPSQPPQAIKSQALVAGISKANQGFDSLEYVNQEINTVESHLPTQTLINEAFTKESLERSLLETQTPIVHIATHGQFSSKASDTFIAAWNERIDIEQLHQLLSSRDRNQLSPTELLILSACETALGDESAALGLAGVAVRAGARSTLASLWSINDQSTALLMESFYQQLSQLGSTKSQSLRQAQLSMLEKPRYEHPYYWSAFVLMGNWQ